MTAPIRHGELRVADLNPRRGTEAGKLRPVVILQTDLLNDATRRRSAAIAKVAKRAALASRPPRTSFV